MAVLNPDLLAILACPACDERPPLELRGDYLVCNHCRRAYPIHDDIPALLVEESIPLEQIGRESEPPQQV